MIKLDPNFLLFFEEHPLKAGKQPLFKNRVELAKELIALPDFPYFTNPNDQEAYSKQFNKLKIFITQILSADYNRVISEDFKKALNKLILAKFEDQNIELATQTYESIIKSINELNIPNFLKQKDRFDPDETFFEMLECQKMSNYTVIITSRPVELEESENIYYTYLKNELIFSLIDPIFSEKPLNSVKKYRFNFPNKRIVSMFWQKLHTLILFKLLEQIQSESSILDRLLKFASNNKSILSSMGELNLSNQIALKGELIKFVNSYLSALNQNRIIMIFFVDSPIFVIPHCVFDPSDSIKSKGYLFLNNDENKTTIYKYSERDLQAWKDYVWDALRGDIIGENCSYDDFSGIQKLKH